MKGKHFLKLLDFTPEQIGALLDLAAELKAKKKAGIPHKLCAGKNIVLLFEKDSTRTRCAFEVAGYDLGMGVTYLGPSGSQMGKKESVADTARVLGRMFDGIEYRGYGQSIVEELAEFAGVPGVDGRLNSRAGDRKGRPYAGRPWARILWLRALLKKQERPAANAAGPNFISSRNP